MRFLVVGAGALGGYYGGLLVRGGADVTFLVRQRRASQLAERGLVIRAPDSETVIPVKTVLAGDLEGPYDVVLLACKAYDLDRALDDFAPVLGSDGAVLPVLNGFNHIAVLSERFGARRVLGGVVVFLVSMTPEGDIVVPGYGSGQTAFGELTGEQSRRCNDIQTALAAGGVQSAISNEIVAEMWTKFCGMAASSTIAALTRSRAGRVAAAPASARVAAEAFDECAAVARAEGYPPPASMRELVLGLWAQPGSQYGPSLLSDIETGRPTEGDHIVGDMVRRADHLGLDVPLLRAALCCLQIYEAGRHATAT